MVATAGAGPEPIPHRQLNSRNLSQAIKFCLSPRAIASAQAIAAKIRAENGVKAAVASFHRNLPLETLQCDILKDQPATWLYKSGRKKVKLSKKAAEILIDHLKITPKKLEL